MMHFLVQIWKASLYLVLTYRPDKLTSPKWGKFGLSSSIWPWRSLSITPQNNRDLNQGLLHLWSKFGDPSLNGWWIIARTSSWLTDPQTHTHTHTHAGNDNTRRPKLASGNKRAPLLCYFKLCASFRSHWWIQTGVTVRKRPIWVKFNNF